MDYVRLEVVEEHIGVVTFSRPPINAVDLQANVELAEIFEEIACRSDLYCVILRAEGKGFMSGSDTGEFGGFDEQLLKDNEDADIRTIMAVYNCPVPVICQIQGYCMGHGITLAAVSDIVIAADDAYMALPEVTICVVGGTDALHQFVPEKFLRYMAYTGKKIGIGKIAEFGGILKVVPREEAFGAAMETAREIAANYSRSVRCVKAAIHDLMAHDKPKNFYVDCKYTHELLTDPLRPEILAAHAARLEEKRRAKERARLAAEGKEPESGNRDK